MKKIVAATPLPGPHWTANTFVDGQPNVSGTTRQHERHECDGPSMKGRSWVARAKSRIHGAHCPDQTHYAYPRAIY